MNGPGGLALLLRTLRLEGFVVGYREVARLRHLFETAPTLDEHRLKVVLALVLTHTPDEREKFDPIFDAWFVGQTVVLERAEADRRVQVADSGAIEKNRAPLDPIGDGEHMTMPLMAPQDHNTQRTQATGSRWPTLPRWPWWQWAALSAVLLTVALVALLRLTTPEEPVTEQPKPKEITTGLEVPPPDLQSIVTPVPITFRIPITYKQHPLTWETLAPLLYGLSAVVAYWGLRRWRKRHGKLPSHQSSTPLLPPGPAPTLLSSIQLRQIVWGIDHFVSDLPSPELDMESTVAESARRGGIPTPIHQPERHPRAVWIWRDVRCKNESAAQISTDIQQELNRYGMPVVEFRFEGVPIILVDHNNHEVRQPDPDEWGNRTVIAVMTDGGQFQRALRKHPDKDTLAWIQWLQRWPRLAIVDFSNERPGLEPVCRRWRLQSVLPNELPDFLADTPGPVEPAPWISDVSWTGPLASWRAACVIAPRPVDLQTALLVHQSSGLKSPRETVGSVLAELNRWGGGGAEYAHQRAEWLSAWSDTVDSESLFPEPDSLIGRAVRFWRTELQREQDVFRVHHGVVENGGASQAICREWQKLKLDDALLTLWTDPDQAVVTLVDHVTDSEVRKQAADKLRVYQTRDYNDDNQSAIRLPWCKESVSVNTWNTLRQWGFGQKKSTAPRWGARGWTLFVRAALVGIVIVALGVSAAKWFNEAKEVVQETLDIDMMGLPGGTFLMGSPETEEGRYEDEGPQRLVRVDSFWMGVTEVTQAQYRAVMGDNPSYFKGDDLPVENLKWFDAVRFCNTLSQKEGLTPVYEIDGDTVKRVNKSADGYRLPTEAEWEYAARAGTQTAYFFGDDVSKLEEYAWFVENSDDKTHSVGTVGKIKKANPWGLYDMYGNVWEWCWDWYGDYTTENPTTGDKPTNDNNTINNPTGPKEGASGVIRGGSFRNVARNLRSSCRDNRSPDNWSWNLGFRIVRSSFSQH